MLLVFFASVAAFLMGVVAIRAMRKNLSGEPEPERVVAEGSTAFTLAAYDSVIKQLREKEQELQKQQQEERDRASVTESIRETMLANIPSGTLFFDRQGIVRQANPAARSILGYASPLGFHIRDLFRGITEVRWPDGHRESSPAGLVEGLYATARESAPFLAVEAEYSNQTGGTSTFSIAAWAVRLKNAELIGAVCIIGKH